MYNFANQPIVIHKLYNMSATVQFEAPDHYLVADTFRGSIRED